MPSKINNDEMINKIIEVYKNGATKKEICKKFKLSQPTVRRIIKENTNDVFPRISTKTQQKIIQLSKTVSSKTNIAKKLKIDRNTVSRVLDFNNINISKPKIKKLTKYEQFKNIHNPESVSILLQKSMYHAVKQLKVSEVMIKRYAEEFNLKINKPFIRYDQLDETIKQQINIKFLEGYTKKELSTLFNLGKRVIDKVIDSTTFNEKIFKDQTKQDEMKKYAKLARRLTRVTIRFYNIKLDNNEHIDHKYSIFDGFNNNIPVGIIASIENLQIISSIENLNKGESSIISKNELYELVNV